MITIERIIPYPQKLDINTMNQTPVPLSEKDITDIRTNKDISLKLVDADGNTILLIEAITYNIDADEIAHNITGCFIKRFECIRELLNISYFPIIEKCLNTFMTHVKYHMIPLGDNGFLSKYQYLWTMKNNREECIIAMLYGFYEISESEIAPEIRIYKYDLI